MAEVTVHFDKELRRLNPRHADAWRAWLVQHQLDHMSIACPSVLVYREPTPRRLAQLTVQLLLRDPQGPLRTKKTITFSGPLAFPPGYRVTRQEPVGRPTKAPAA
jgi:hypothetical protein